MKIFITIALVFAALDAAASDTFQSSVQAAAPAHPALYSFADVYRLTVSGTALSGFPGTSAGDSPIRVAIAQSAPAPEQQFSIVGAGEPERWLLLLAGMALAAWVARRRLGYFF
jgi:hypothetical protein